MIQFCESFLACAQAYIAFPSPDAQLVNHIYVNQDENPSGNIDINHTDNRAMDDVFSLVYEELRHLAHLMRRSSGTLNPTALVHEAWFKLRDSPDLASLPASHFKAIAARAMRQILVDAARRRNAQKRVAPDNWNVDLAKSDAELLTLNSALDELARLNPRQAQVVDFKFFGGMSVPEAAALLNVSESVVERDWRAARALLGSILQPHTE